MMAGTKPGASVPRTCRFPGPERQDGWHGTSPLPNPAEPLTVADMARAAGLSPAHFSREFKRAFGESPHQYLLTRRLERAAALLRVTDWSVADVCFAVGAGSVGSFTTSFGRVFGRSPIGLPPLVASGGSLRPDSALRGHGLRPAAKPHVSRRPGGRRFVGLGFLPVALAHLRRDPDDQDCQRPVLGARPGPGTSLLHQDARLGGPRRRHHAGLELPLAGGGASRTG